MINMQESGILVCKAANIFGEVLASAHIIVTQCKFVLQCRYPYYLSLYCNMKFDLSSLIIDPKGD